MITFFGLINLPINVALKYLYSLSLIPRWGGHREEPLRPRFKGAFVTGSSFRVGLSVEGCFTQEHALPGVTHIWVPLMDGVKVRCRALCGPEFYIGLATALILTVVLSVLASHFTPTGADFFCTPTLPWCGLTENLICDTFIGLGLTRFLKCIDAKI